MKTETYPTTWTARFIALQTCPTAPIRIRDSWSRLIFIFHQPQLRRRELYSSIQRKKNSTIINNGLRYRPIKRKIHLSQTIVEQHGKKLAFETHTVCTHWSRGTLNIITPKYFVFYNVKVVRVCGGRLDWFTFGLCALWTTHTAWKTNRPSYTSRTERN